MFINNRNWKITEISTLLHPPAKLCYALIAQHNVGWSARVQMLYIYHLNSVRETPFHTTFQGQSADAQWQEE